MFSPGLPSITPYTDPMTNSYYNGIWFLNLTLAYAADVVNHRVVELTLQVQGGNSVVTSARNFCSSSFMLQPCAVAISRSGTVFTSGMN